MPWKGEKDPYKIWLSEIILQQTRVEQGLAYYEAFIRAFPDIRQLASAPEEKVLKLWEGLGYYSRCRNLISTAKFIAGERKGLFPDTYESILALKGVGPYTAAAISSFAFNLPHAVVDGNVFRVLARVFGIGKATDTTEGKKYFTALAQELLDIREPGIYNQAIMDFGATICKPAAPLCTGCVFAKHCAAFQQGKVNEWPVKEKKIRVRPRWFYYFVMEYRQQRVIRQRTGKDIWQGLYEFPLIETTGETSIEKLLRMAVQAGWLQSVPTVSTVSPVFRQQLSHQLITGQFIRIRFTRKPVLPADGQWVDAARLSAFPFPRFINQYLESPSPR